MKLSQILNHEQILLLEEMNSNAILFLEAELQQSDEEPDYSSDEPTVADPNNPQDPNAQHDPNAPVAPADPAQPVDENGNPIPPEPTAEEVFMYELEGAEDKFIQMILYNKLIELDNKIELLQLSVQDGIGVKSKYFYDRLNQYKQYVEVLNELIFSISTATIYKLVGQIELELVELLNEYTISYNDNLIYDEAREAKK